VQLAVLLAPVKIDHWDAIGQISSKRIYVVVNKQNFCQVQALKNSQVLHIERFLPMSHFAAVLTEIPVLNESASWVKLVDDWVRVPVVTSCEHSHFVL
jgi:hypothetical protein